MRLDFSENDKENGLNIVDIPDEELTLLGDFLEGEGRQFKITGTAEIEGEKYKNFEIEFYLDSEPANITTLDIMSIEWEWYDFIF